MPTGRPPNARGSKPSRDPRSGPLTRREYEVIDLIIDGHSNESICNQFHISGNTIKRHMQNIFGKLSVASRLELAVKILKQRHAGELKAIRENRFDF
jgi:ATP/maltotriose-dependent transcriptional regulator MalT